MAIPSSPSRRPRRRPFAPASVGVALALSVALAATPLTPASAAAPTAQAIAQVGQLLDAGGLPGSQVSALFVGANGGPVLYARSPDLGLQPASTLKLLVTATALSDLGPGYRFTTRIVGRAKDGTVLGDLYLVGSGDPLFNDQDLARMAAQVARHVRRIDGAVAIDGSFFAGPYGAGWEADNAEYGWSAPPEALTLDLGQIVATVRPGRAVGASPTIQVTPAADSVVEMAATTTARGTADTLNAYWPGGGDAGIVVRGAIPEGSPPVRLTVSVPDPDRWAADLFRTDLEKDGVTIAGGVAVATAPVGTPVLARFVSSSLRSLLVQQDKWSINISAEDLLRVVGAHVYGGPGTAAKGIAAEMAWLRSQHIAWSGRVVDGCGLSLDDRVSAQDLVNLLARARTERWFPDLLAALPVAGGAKGLVAGTLGEIGLFVGFRGHVWAKTGDVANVENLAGYVQSASGQWLVFAALVNGQPSWLAGWRAEEAAVEAVART